jgi:hypothetical protein
MPPHGQKQGMAPGFCGALAKKAAAGGRAAAGVNFQR